MKARVLKTFHDLKARAVRKKGDEFEVTPERFKEINAAGFGNLVESATLADHFEVEQATVAGVEEVKDG